MKIVVCSLDGRSFPVLEASVRAYAPETEILHLTPVGMYLINKSGSLLWSSLCNDFTNFGDAYNAAIDYTFDTYDDDAVIVANDDVVLTPHTMRLLTEDVANLCDVKLGWLGARSDFVLPAQNIRCPLPNDAFSWLRFESENRVKQTSVIAPVFAYISRKAFTLGRFPPINWYSDNVSCADLSAQGFVHYVSRAYVHHSGSQTVGSDSTKLTLEAKAWMVQHRPQYLNWF